MPIFKTYISYYTTELTSGAIKEVIHDYKKGNDKPKEEQICVDTQKVDNNTVSPPKDDKSGAFVVLIDYVLPIQNFRFTC